MIAIDTMFSYLLTLPFLPASDGLAARLTKGINGIRGAEVVLGAFHPAMIVAAARLVLFGMAAENTLHWIGYHSYGVGMV